jgi:hypothetical protein
MNTAISEGSITLAIIILLLSSYHPSSYNQAQGQLPECPIGFHRSPNGDCEQDLGLSGLERYPNELKEVLLVFVNQHHQQIFKTVLSDTKQI